MRFQFSTGLRLSLYAVIAALSSGLPADACTRCVYLGKDGTVVVARSMDWMEDPHTDLYVYPRGLKRTGGDNPNPIEWTSKYGSLTCSFYGVATVDGINEKGLVANTLYLVESDYGKLTPGTRSLSIFGWAQYALDNYATVSEAVEGLAKEPFRIVAPVLPDGTPAQGHLSLSDPSGDSAIFEYIDGNLQIHHGRQYQVMTNSPPFNDQLALNTYWDLLGGESFLPGGIRASDRFIRTSYFIKAIPQTETGEKAIASVFSVIRGVSVPLGITTPGEPNVASTLWRTVYDQQKKICYFDSAVSPTVFWVPLNELDFSEKAAVKKLELSKGQTYEGSAAGSFQPSQAFPFALPKH